jgi:glutamine synthetase
VENTKGEADSGQHEVNYRYSDALDTADNHVVIKQAVKDIAHAKGKSVTFMAKYDHRKAGSSSHVHQSLWGLDGAAAFADAADPQGMSVLMKQFLAGQLAHARDITAFLAPYVNSYKRFCIGMFAPTKAVWSADNRTAGFRVCGEWDQGRAGGMPHSGGRREPLSGLCRACWPPVWTGSSVGWIWSPR